MAVILVSTAACACGLHLCPKLLQSSEPQKRHCTTTASSWLRPGFRAEGRELDQLDLETRRREAGKELRRSCEQTRCAFHSSRALENSVTAEGLHIGLPCQKTSARVPNTAEQGQLVTRGNIYSLTPAHRSHATTDLHPSGRVSAKLAALGNHCPASQALATPVANIFVSTRGSKEAIGQRSWMHCYRWGGAAACH